MLAGCGRVGFDARDDAGGDGLLPPGASITLVLPEGGQMRELAVSPTDGAWYVRTYFGGAYGSLDRGITWTRCGAISAEGLEVDSTGTLWAAGPDVYRSTDHCATWTPTQAPRATLDIGVYGDEVWAVGDQGIWKRVGAAWQQRTTPLDGYLFARFGGAPPNARIAGTLLGGMVVSTDGTTWVQRPAASRAITDIASSGSALYVYTGADGTVGGGVSCSTMDGLAWTSCYPSGGFALAADSLEAQHVVFAIYDDLAETRDTFSNVTRDMRRAGGMTNANVRELQYTQAGTLIAATERGVFVSAPGPLAFQPRFAGISAWTIDDIFVDGTDVFLGTEAGPLRSRNGQPFEVVPDGMEWATRALRMAFAPDQTLLAPGRQIWASRDRGTTWTLAEALDGADGYQANAIAFIGTRAIAGTKQRILISDPPYDTWTSRAVGVAGTSVFEVAVAGGTDLYIASEAGLFVSLDVGVTVQPVAAVATSTRALAVLDDGSVVVATGAGLRISDPARSQWSTHLPALDVDDVIAQGQRIVAISSFDDEVFYSPDGGLSWQRVSTPIGIHVATAAFDTDGSLVLGTYGYGLIRVAI